MEILWVNTPSHGIFLSVSWKSKRKGKNKNEKKKKKDMEEERKPSKLTIKMIKSTIKNRKCKAIDHEETLAA